MADKRDVGKYRVRRGLFGVAVLQRCFDFPSLIGGQVDATIRNYEWRDIPFKLAPFELLSASDPRRHTAGETGEG